MTANRRADFPQIVYMLFAVSLHPEFRDTEIRHNTVHKVGQAKSKGVSQSMVEKAERCTEWYIRSA